MGKGRFRKSPWFWPIVLAVMVHTTMASWLIWQRFIMPEPKAVGPRTDMLDLSAASEDAHGNGQIEQKQLGSAIEAGVANASAMSDVQKKVTIEEKAAWLERNASPESVQQISELVKKSVNAPDRAYEPLDPPPAGAFDFDSMLPYSSKRQVGDDKIERSVQVWVDKDGRSMTQTVRRTADANGVMHEYRGTYSTDGKLFESEVPVSGNGTADSVIETMSKSPMLHQLFTNGLLPALEAVRTKQEAKPSAPSQTPEASGSPAGTDKP